MAIPAPNRTFWQFPHQIAHLSNFRVSWIRGIDANRQKTASIRLRAAEGHNFATAEFFQNPQNPFKIPTRVCLELESDHFLQLAPLLRINSYSGCIFDFGYLLT